MEERPDSVRKLFESAEPEVKQVVLRIFQLENQRLHMSRPHGIIEDIVDAVKKLVP